MRTALRFAFPVLCCLWLTQTLGCGEPQPTTYVVRRGPLVAGVWECRDEETALETIAAWVSADLPSDHPMLPTHGDDDLESMIPPTGAVPNWEQAGEAREITPALAPLLLSGSATIFDAFGFVRGFRSEYRQPKLSTRPLLECSVYDMGTPENAFGLYSRRRIPGGEFRMLGAEAAFGDNLIFGWKDRYCFEASISEYGTDTSEAMWQFADWIGRRIKGVTEPPSLIAELPMPNVKRRSPRWFRTSDQALTAASHRELLTFPLSDETRGFTARLMTTDEATSEAFCVVFRSDEDARRAYESLRDAIRDGTDVQPLDKIGDDGFRAVVPAP